MSLLKVPPVHRGLAWRWEERKGLWAPWESLLLRVERGCRTGAAWAQCFFHMRL